MSPSDPLSELAKDSICFSSQTQMVRLDDATEEVEQTYLTLAGTPEGFRWLARQLTRMATSADKHSATSVIIAPRDFSAKPVSLDGWDSLDLHCRQKD